MIGPLGGDRGPEVAFTRPKSVTPATRTQMEVPSTGAACSRALKRWLPGSSGSRAMLHSVWGAEMLRRSSDGTLGKTTSCTAPPAIHGTVENWMRHARTGKVRVIPSSTHWNSTRVAPLSAASR